MSLNILPGSLSLAFGTYLQCGSKTHKTSPISSPLDLNDGTSVKWYTALKPMPYWPVALLSSPLLPSPRFWTPFKSASVNGLLLYTHNAGPCSGFQLSSNTLSLAWCLGSWIKQISVASASSAFWRSSFKRSFSLGYNVRIRLRRFVSFSLCPKEIPTSWCCRASCLRVLTPNWAHVEKGISLWTKCTPVSCSIHGQSLVQSSVIGRITPLESGR